MTEQVPQLPNLPLYVKIVYATGAALLLILGLVLGPLPGPGFVICSLAALALLSRISPFAKRWSDYLHAKWGGALDRLPPSTRAWYDYLHNKIHSVVGYFTPKRSGRRDDFFRE